MIEMNIRKQLDRFFLNISWKGEREIIVLFGPSGAGKSMTLQMIAGLSSPDSGEIRVNEETFFDSESGIDLPPQQRKVGYLFQNYALFPHMTVMENIRFGHESPRNGEAQEKGREMIALFHLEGIEQRYPGEISGGQQQRTALARALMRSPSILLLDEPFAAVDLPVRRILRRELKELQKKLSIPMILVTHDFSEALAMADKLLIYHQGTLLQEGAPQEIVNHPANDIVSELVGSFLLSDVRKISF